MPTFDLDLIRFLAEHRTPAATAFFSLFTFAGEIEGYVLVVAIVYAVFDKALAFRMAVLVLVTMSLNHLLKTLIANPRPFVAEGTYLEKWEVSESTAHEIAPEYSTPSGHAMGGSAFYSYLYGSVTSRAVRAVAVATILLTGLSRPYLGVHYLEDVLLGWGIGIALALLALRFGGPVGAAWNRRSVPQRALIAVAMSAAVLIATDPLYAAGAFGQPLLIVSYLGFLSGILVAQPLEARWVGFEPRSGTALRKALRVVIAVALVIGTLALLDRIFALLASDTSAPGRILRFVRYASAGAVGLLLAPFLFVRLGLAEGRVEERRPDRLKESST